MRLRAPRRRRARAAGRRRCVRSHVPMSSSFVRIVRIASSSSRASASGHQRAPAASMPAMSVGCGAAGRAHGERAPCARRGRSSRRRARSDDPSRVVGARERRQRDAARGRRAGRCAPRAPARGHARPRRTRRASRSRRRAASPSRAGRARPRTSVQKTSARSWRTWRLSVTRVRPPVPGSTPSSGTSGSDTDDERSSISTDLVARERQLVPAARAGAVHGGDELEAGVAACVLDAVARLVRELAEVDLPRVRRQRRA